MTDYGPDLSNDILQNQWLCRAGVPVSHPTQRSESRADNSILSYPVINALLSFFAVLPGMFLVDTLGRRGILMLSCGGQAFWLFMLAGLGSKKVKNTSIRNTVVAAFMMNSITYK